MLAVKFCTIQRKQTACRKEMNLYYVLDIHVVISLGFHCISYKNHIMSPPLYYAELFNPVKKKHTVLHKILQPPPYLRSTFLSFN